MATTHRVAIFSTSLDDYSYGAHIYDLTADQINKVLKNATPDTAALGTQQPVMEYRVHGGGRAWSWPTISREEFSQTMQGVEITILMVCVDYDLMSEWFYEHLLENNLLDNCKFVVARIIDDHREQKGNSRSGNITYPALKTERSATDVEVLNQVGFQADKFKGKLYVINVSSSKKKLSKKISKVDYQQRLEAAIAPIISELTGEEVKAALIGPVKETVTAGKMLIDVGQRLGRWMSSQIKSH